MNVCVCVSVSVLLLHFRTAVYVAWKMLPCCCIDSRPVIIATIVRKSGDCEQYVDVGKFLMDPQVKVKVCFVFFLMYINLR